MRSSSLRLTVLLVSLIFAACVDSPTGAPADPGTAGALAGCSLRDDGSIICSTLSPDWTCEPESLDDWCQGEDGSDECVSSAGGDAQTVQGCPDGEGSVPEPDTGPGGGPGDGGNTGGDESPPPCPEHEPECNDPPPAEECEECNPPEEEDADICPQPLSGRTLEYGVTIAGRMHTFQFSGTMRRDSGGRSPAWYTISGPTASKDNWWYAESGKILVVCYGRWIARTLWIGQLYVVDDDLHFVMGPGHPDF